MTEPALVHIAALRVAFARGSIVALDGIDLMLGEGVIGLVGANGAGKTTLLRCIAGGLALTSGSVRIRGREASAYRESQAVGYIPSQPRFPAYLTVRQLLEGLRRICGNPAATEAEHQLAADFEIDLLADRRLNALSLGQTRRVEVVAALIGDPDLVLFDEPTNGLDPIAMAHLRRGIIAARRPGRCIVVSSHHLDELQRLAERVLFLREGRLAGDYAAGELAADGGSIESRFLSTELRAHA